jgi:probable addiction module antidote protein
MKTTRFDLAEFLDTKEDIATGIEFALEENDTPYLFALLEALPRAEGTTAIAKELHTTREALCQSLFSSGDHTLTPVLQLLQMLGMGLRIVNPDGTLYVQEAKNIATEPEAKAA